MMSGVLTYRSSNTASWISTFVNVYKIGVESSYHHTHQFQKLCYTHNIYQIFFINDISCIQQLSLLLLCRAKISTGCIKNIGSL